MDRQDSVRLNERKLHKKRHISFKNNDNTSLDFDTIESNEKSLHNG